MAAGWHTLWIIPLALVVWTGLRAIASTTFRTEHLGPRLLLRELSLFLLCLLIGLAPAWNLRPAQTPAFLAPLIVLGLLLPFAAFVEGEDGSRHRWLRLSLALVALVGHARALPPLVQLHDAVIAHGLVKYPGDLGRLLPILVIAIAALTWGMVNALGWGWRVAGVVVCVALVTELGRVLNAPGLAGMLTAVVLAGLIAVDCWTRRVAMNRLAGGLLRLWFSIDRLGQLHAWVRHLGHVGAKASISLVDRTKVLPWLAVVALGSRPRPEPEDTPRDYDRTYILLRWEEAMLLAWDHYRKWRAASLRSTTPPDARAARAALDEACRWERIRQLSDACPHEPCRTQASEEQRWARVERTMRLLAPGEALGKCAASARATSAPSLIDDIEDLQKSHSSLAALIAVVKRWLERNEIDDMQRWRDREALVEFARVEKAHAGIAFVVLADLFRAARDWAGLLEAARQMELRAGYTPALADHLELGEACLRHTEELPPGELSDWLRERAIGHFLQGQCVEHLRGNPAPRTGESHEQSAPSREPAHA